MNVDTGRIYSPEEVERFSSPMVGFVSSGQEFPTMDPEALEFQKLRDEGKIVEVSAEVAQKMKLGERELERRAKRRKATKAARKRNR